MPYYKIHYWSKGTRRFVCVTTQTFAQALHLTSFMRTAAWIGPYSVRIEEVQS